MKEKTEKEELFSREFERFSPEINDKAGIDVDKAWNKVLSKINVESPVISMTPDRRLLPGRMLLRVAASLLILIGLAAAAVYTFDGELLNKRVIASTGEDQKNVRISLPDGSIVTLNHNSILIYREKFSKKSRNVSLKGEAFFEITSDASRPFIIDAGKASVKVVGTSFNVITENSRSAVEVFVKTGKVVLSDNSGNRNLVLEPGYIGTMNSDSAEKGVNQNPNYMSWNTGKLEYDGQSLDIVFKDLKRVYDMDIVVDDPSILSNTWTSPIVSHSNDTIIRIICVSFNLSYTRDGNIYHLSRK